MPASTFEHELSIWGPGAASPIPPSVPAARAYCRRLATSHYENFTVVSWLAPRRLRQHLCNIYAYCRWSDDLADELHNPARSLELLEWWRGQLRQCSAGDARHPVFVALAETIREFAIPLEPFEDLISAFEQDQRVHEYDTFTDLANYCRRSANPVGRLVLYLFGQARPEHFIWSDSICTGLQLANFWQDVARDLDIGRIYLPGEDCRLFGYSREDLRQRTTNPAFLHLMQFEVDRTRRFLRPFGDGAPAWQRFPARQQLPLEMFAGGGLKILERIEQIGYRVWDERPVVTKSAAARVGVRSLLNVLRGLLANLRQPGAGAT